MPIAAPTSRPPVMVLATDLSSRCDRAFERAYALAASCGAVLLVVTAVEGDFHKPSWRSAEREALARMQEDMAEALGERVLAWEPVAAPGAPHEVVIDAASRTNAELIVTGMARNETLGRVSPGTTVETLVRRAPCPVLVVRQRASRPYRNILVPTDFSRAGELALIRAAAMFPDGRFTLLHGYRVPFPGFVTEEASHDEFRAAALDQQAAFIARARTRIGGDLEVVGLVEYGEPDRLVADYVSANGADLMVVGAHDRSGVLGALSRDIAGHLLMKARCDVLVVPEAKPLEVAPPARSDA
ncbi:universal stress protein [Brevundimonas sp.]|uniref:universal stress protein n=1 Tax=Brevundimonas sp. TaxID=1871086 RepID=UPI0035B1EB76